MNPVTSTTDIEAPIKTIFVIDDDDMIRILLQESFWIYSKTHIEVVPSRSVAEAKEKLTTGKYPDIIFIGLALLTRNKSGETALETAPTLEFIKEVRHTHPKTKIIVYSKHEEPALRSEALAAGADSYIVKGSHTPSEVAAFVDSL